MRIERRWLGTRIRVILNRTEAVEAALASLNLPEADRPSPRSARVYVGDVGHGAGDFCVDPGKFEKHCRQVAARQIAVPIEASFRVGLDESGSICGATFQFYDPTVSPAHV